MKTLLTAFLVTLLPSLAWSIPRLTPVNGAGLTMQAPAGWKTKSQTQPFAMLVAEQRVGDERSPSVSRIRAPLSQGPQTGPQLVQALTTQLFAPGFKIVGQQQLPGGIGLMLVEGQAKGVAAKMAVAMAQGPQHVDLAIFAAPTKAFNRLGGAELLKAVMGMGGAKGQAQAPPAPQPAQHAGIPARFRRGSTPALSYLAEALDTLKPAQVIGVLQQFNATGHQLLGVYPAFASLVHASACQANGGFVMPIGGTPKSCAQTYAQWRQTLQFTGNMQSALQQANSERNQLVIASRCATGQYDAGTCAAYRSGTAKMNAMNHETSMRIISNMGSNGCLLGDPGCVQ